jgi:hypothetical protein
MEIAVGATRTVAATVFGTLFDDAHVTSYDDVAAEVDLASAGSVGLVGAEQTSGLLADLVARPAPPGHLLLGVPDDLAGLDGLLSALDANPGLRPADLVRLAGAVVVPLVPADQADAGVAERVLAELHGLAPGPQTRPRLLTRLASRLRPPARD